MVRIGILGATGRMGRAIADAAALTNGVEVAGGLGRQETKDAEPAGRDELARSSDVLIDFTTPEALQANLDAAVAAGTPILIGTTGLTEVQHQVIAAASTRVAILQTANTSLGVNVLRALVAQAARLLGPDWDAEIVEMHHRHKLDTPSGTALLLGASVNAGRGASGPTELNRFDRMQAGPHDREEGGVYYASLRGGSVAGDHMVIFAGEGERIELGHRADSRAIFARGALRGALWLASKAAGRYTMNDVLGLPE
jgi:4-hydroxy-tetrahydrodipicolinate reductase